MAIFNSYVKLPEGSILIYSKQYITLHFAQKLAKPGGVSDLNWFQVAQQLLTWYRKITLLRAIPTVTLLCHSFWQLIWKYIWHIFSDILFWHSFLAFYPASILKFFPASLLALYLAFYLTVYSGILSGIYSDILFCHAIWHSFWHMIMYGTSSDIPSGILSGIYSEILCGWGPAGNTLMRSLQLRSGGGGGGGRIADIKSKNPHWHVGERVANSEMQQLGDPLRFQKSRSEVQHIFLRHR